MTKLSGYVLALDDRFGAWLEARFHLSEIPVPGEPEDRLAAMIGGGAIVLAAGVGACVATLFTRDTPAERETWRIQKLARKKARAMRRTR